MLQLANSNLQICCLRVGTISALTLIKTLNFTTAQVLLQHDNFLLQLGHVRSVIRSLVFNALLSHFRLFATLLFHVQKLIDVRCFGLKEGMSPPFIFQRPFGFLSSCLYVDKTLF